MKENNLGGIIVTCKKALENKSGILTNVENFERESVEAPRYSCALAGVYGTTLGIRGGIPILHSGAGCGVGQLFGTLYAGENQQEEMKGEQVPLVPVWLKNM